MPSRLYTRTGDQGSTRLSTGERVSKSSRRVAAYGGLYELNTALGHARALAEAEMPAEPDALWHEWIGALKEIQQRLFLVGRDLSSAAAPDSTTTQKSHTEALEHLIDRLRTVVPPWKPFTLPEGTPAATALYLATTICRRAERNIWTLNQEEPVPQPVMMWVNRLSDLLFISGRYANFVHGVVEERTREPEGY